MKPFFIKEVASMTELKRLSRFIRKMKKFGAYLEVEERDSGYYSVRMFCPLVYTDRLGNMALSRLQDVR